MISLQKRHFGVRDDHTRYDRQKEKLSEAPAQPCAKSRAFRMPAMIIVAENYSPQLPLAIRAASRPIIQAVVSLSQEINRIVIDDESTDLVHLVAMVVRKRRLDAFPNAMTQLIQLLAQSLAAETTTAHKHRPSN